MDRDVEPMFAENSVVVHEETLGGEENFGKYVWRVPEDREQEAWGSLPAHASTVLRVPRIAIPVPARTLPALFLALMNLLKKLTQPHVWERLFYERLTEPLHLNLLALGVAAFGSFRARVKWDLIVRQHNAYAIL